MIPIAISELRMLLRNRLVAVIALAMPLGLGAFLVLNPPEGGIVFASTLQVVVMLGLGVYATTTTTLAARRQNLFLKRLRSGAASDPAIIVGLVAPIALLGLVQVGVVTAGLAVATDTVPAHPWLVALVVIVVDLMFVGLALATAGVTTSPEHAQVTTLPLLLVTLGVPIWVSVADLGWLGNALPGGALPALMQTGWMGGDLGESLLLLLPTLAWAVVAAVAARIMFRWDPRL